MAILKDTFFSIDEYKNDAENFTFDITMHANHPIYAGHFPEMPVAPGVCLAQMVKEIAESIINKTLLLSQARNIKFMAILNPFENEKVQIELQLKEQEGEYIIRAHCKNAEKSFFKIDASYCLSMI